MNTLLVLMLALLQSGSPRLEQAATVEYPFTTTGTQWVLVDLETSPHGTVQSVQILQGASPFLEVVLSNVRDWQN